MLVYLLNVVIYVLITFKYYQCFCINAKQISGEYCAHDIDECRNDPCLNGGTCLNKWGFYTCNCTTGYGGINCAEASNLMKGPSISFEKIIFIGGLFDI